MKINTSAYALEIEILFISSSPPPHHTRKHENDKDSLVSFDFLYENTLTKRINISYNFYKQIKTIYINITFKIT